MAGITLHPEADNLRFPLRVYEQYVVGELVSGNNERFRMHAGLDRDLMRQLRKKSLDLSDQELQDNSSDFKRFGEGSYEEWYAKGRAPFALVHAKDTVLAAIVWIGPKPLGEDSATYLTSGSSAAADSGSWHTIAFRSYNPYRGERLMKAFVRAVVKLYKRSYPSGKIWTITDRANIGSQKLSSAIGLVPIRDDGMSQRLVMAEPVE